jgi:DNA-binding CsgD family transcriptional regulator
VQINQEVARTLWGLSPAEATLLALLVRGTSPTEAATQLGPAVDTVRKRLKVIFEKTGTHRQAELVSLALGAGL